MPLAARQVASLIIKKSLVPIRQGVQQVLQTDHIQDFRYILGRSVAAEQHIVVNGVIEKMRVVCSANTMRRRNEPEPDRLAMSLPLTFTLPLSGLKNLSSIIDDSGFAGPGRPRNSVSSASGETAIEVIENLGRF